ncbi:MAG: LysR family transcriptional regulator, partial [Clostridiales Family XIII bacterium]|nr:LysR family transcriptional regulator [Clostridiales Family XIII bacterium]
MEIRHLQYFRQVCADRSMTKAAENLFITQQGLSHAIKMLERELNVSLFFRNKSGVVPTEAAMGLLGEAEEILVLFDALKEKMQAASQATEGIVRLALTAGAMSYFAPKFVGEFHERYPHIKLHLVEKPDMACERLLANGEVDVACTTGPVDNASIEWRLLFSDSVIIMMRKSNPLAARDSLCFRDLEREDLILPPIDFKWHDIIIKSCRDAGFEPRISYTIGDLHAVFRIITENGGIGFMHKNLADTFREREIALVPLHPDEKLHWRLGCAKKKGARLSQA